MLKRELRLLHVFCIAAGAMISSGLFVLPGIAYAKAGPAMILSYALAGLLMVPSLLAQTELATAMPRSGGSYFFVERSLGPLVGTFAGLANWFSITLKASFAMIGIGALATLIVPGESQWVVKGVAVAACLVFTAVNLVSVKSTGRLQTFLVLGLLALLVLYIGAGTTTLDGARYSQFMPAGTLSVVAVAGMVFVSFGGLTKVVDVSEEVHRPHVTLPLGMFLAFGTVIVLYILVVSVTVGTVAPAHLSGSLVPLALGAEAMLGRIGLVLVSIAALFAFATTANAGILSASRSPMAMGRDGLLPEVLSRTNHRWNTPHIAIALTAAFVMLAVVFLSVEDLVKTASTMLILVFVFLNLAVIIMRTSGFQSYRPSIRAPLYPWLQIAAIVVYVFLIIDMGRVPLIVTGGFAVLACVWYFAYVHRRIDRESAFVFVVKKIAAKDLQRTGLEKELRQISLERDDRMLDRFDRLMKYCPILDIDTAITADELFDRAAAALADRLQVAPTLLRRRLAERERQSSTVVRPGLSIPHVVIEGHNVFEVLLVRAREGITFPEADRPVTTAFVLVGSLDERNYHLRALMTIAHLVQEADFEKRWAQARNAEELRDVVLLSTRKREHW
ncbi:MAG: amino acid permease [Verrucomicrobia bacterium]|nr:amino acid permease [Verrucomicrobiota bacterium]